MVQFPTCPRCKRELTPSGYCFHCMCKPERMTKQKLAIMHELFAPKEPKKGGPNEGNKR